MTTDAGDWQRALDRARMAWMTGQAVAGDLPELDAFDPQEASLRLLALHAQFHALATMPLPEARAETVPDLPDAPRPYAPDPARPHIRRILSEGDAEDRGHLLHLLDRRGVMAHPFDFMPGPSMDDLPAAYAPLLGWLHRRTPDTAPDGIYNREDMQAHFAALMQAAPADATTWLSAELEQGTAQQRLRLLQDIGHLLRDPQVDLLQHLMDKDRSPKVATLARQLLLRLGAETPRPEDLGPLDYIEEGRAGMLRRRVTFTVPGTISNTRRTLLVHLMAQISLGQLAAHFGQTETTFLDAWNWTASHDGVNRALVLATMTTGADSTCAHLWQMLPLAIVHDGLLEAPHLARLPQRLRDDIARAQIARIQPDHTGSVLAATRRLLTLGLTLSPDLAAGLRQKAEAHRDLDPPEAQTGAHLFGETLRALGFALTADAARALLETLAKRGMHAADPVLSPLHLNIALRQQASKGPWT